MHATRPTQQTLSETSTAQSKQKRRIIQSEMAGKRHLHENVNFPRISLGTMAQYHGTVYSVHQTCQLYTIPTNSTCKKKIFAYRTVL
jgi:hypothetical protein